MRKVMWAAGVVATLLLLCVKVSIAVPSRDDAGGSKGVASRGASPEGMEQAFRELPRDASPVSASQDSDADRGCCIWNTTDVKCAYANRGYCKSKAEELRVTYDFLKETSCRQVSRCPQQN